eukprot:scaffold9320_cov71-Cyclotella_meneghiniana.AAC.5
MSYRHSLDYNDTESVRALLKRCGFRPPPHSGSSSGSGTDETSRTLQELQHRHDVEMNRLFTFLEEELTKIGKVHSQQIEYLQEELEDSRTESAKLIACQEELVKLRLENQFLRKRLDKSRFVSVAAEDKLRLASHEIQAANSEVLTTCKMKSALERDVAMLRNKIKEQHDEMARKRRDFFSEIDQRDIEIAQLKDELRVMKENNDRKAIIDKDAEIERLKRMSLSSVKELYMKDAADAINIENRPIWEIESELTNDDTIENLKRKKLGFKSLRTSFPPINNQAPLSTRSNKPLKSPTLLGEEISLSYSNSKDENEEHEQNELSPKINIWRDLKKDVDSMLSKKLERMYCKSVLYDDSK